jgi:hypothetical protein
MSGSYAKNTAINTKFDFDLVCPFKRNAFATLKEMNDNVHDFLYEKYNGNGATVLNQKVSVGIQFDKDTDNHQVNIDVVPGRELNIDQYLGEDLNSKKLNLYVYHRYGNFDASSERIQTNIHAQISNIKDRASTEKDSIRKIIRLLKVWKKTKGDKYPTKSFFLELATLKAFENNDITGNLWDKLKFVLTYIKDEVVKENFKLLDPGNSSNNLADTLTTYDKQNLSTDLNNMLNRIEENSANIISYFPENLKFKEEEEKEEENLYQNKNNNFYSVPPKNERFG